MSKASSQTTKISSLAFLIIVIVFALSLVAIYLALTSFLTGEKIVAGYLILIGFLGIGSSLYVLFQMRRRTLALRMEAPPITTVIECKKCGFKSVREFQRGDYIFKEVEPCQKCNEKMVITAIYREVKRKKPSTIF